MRWLVLGCFWLPFCFTAAPLESRPQEEPFTADVCLAGVMFAPVGASVNQPWTTLACLLYAADLGARCPPELRAYPAVAPTGDLVSGMPWLSLSLTTLDDSERLLTLDPVAFLEESEQRYDRGIHGYTCEFRKHEMIGKKEHEEEVIAVCFREEPFSVFFRWEKGARFPSPTRTLYVAGESDNKLVVPVLGRRRNIDPEGSLARDRARYPMTQFGVRNAAHQLIESWRQTRTANIGLSVDYRGKRVPPDDSKLLPFTDRLKALDQPDYPGGQPPAEDQLCYTLVSTRAEPEGPDGLIHAIVYIRVKDRLLIRTELYGENDRPVAVYHFANIDPNPSFDAHQFDPEIVEKK